MDERHSIGRSDLGPYADDTDEVEKIVHMEGFVENCGVDAGEEGLHLELWDSK